MACKKKKKKKSSQKPHNLDNLPTAQPSPIWKNPTSYPPDSLKTKDFKIAFVTLALNFFTSQTNLTKKHRKKERDKKDRIEQK